jgi:alpha-tubulin suppressor-like RCC1 family protein
MCTDRVIDGVRFGSLAPIWIAAALLAGCQNSGPLKGGLVVVVGSDLSIPQDIDHVHLDVTQMGTTLFSEDHDVGAGKLLIPAEFRIKYPGNNNPVTVHGVAYKDQKPLIERSGVTPVPVDRVAVLRLSLNYLCEGTAKPDGSSTCGAGQTCKLGTCQTSTVPTASLPAYQPPAPPMDGGASVQSTAGTCFDVLACFARSAPTDLDLSTCSIKVAPDAVPGRINVALQLPAGSGGICDDKQCWVPMDQGDEGWTLAGTLLSLPPAVCKPRADGRPVKVAVTTACGTKTATVPTCGTWSSAMAPIESPPPPPRGGETCTVAESRACGQCGTQTRACEEGMWSDWSVCSAEGACAAGATRACGHGGTQLCGSTCQWAECLGQTCDGPGSQSCGNCGTQTRACNNGTWSDWSACGGQGACPPNQTQSCGAGGTQVCGGSCQWGTCGSQVCMGPASEACGNCGTRTRSCDGSTGQWSAWSACTGAGECARDQTRSCGNGGTQSCGGDCHWSSACMGQMCMGSPSQPCDNCGTQTRTCDGSTGQWSAWSTCMNQGACSLGATQACGSGGTRTCSSSCQWPAECPGQVCMGPPTQTCGNCGTQARTCDSNTGQWSAWSTCTNQGLCHDGNTQMCNGTGPGTQTCTASCQWGACSCTVMCTGKCGGADGCGGTCPNNCPAGQTCGGGNPGTPNVCGCTAETDAGFCTRLGKNCGSVTANDNCGASRTVDCGTCAGTGQSCGGGNPSVANVCGCTAMMDAEFCANKAANCGSVTATDNCGSMRTVASCGTCPASQTCGGDGTRNVCGAPCLKQVATGSEHTCAIKVDGTLWCMGLNDAGQLGDGTTMNRNVPTQVTALGNSVAKVSGGNNSTCALKTDGTAWCWGFNVGDGAPVGANQLVPFQMTTLGSNVADVVAGWRHRCARKTDGTLWCWGQNSNGEIGLGTTAAVTVPTQVTALGSAVSDVSIGGHSCARKTDGTLWCWGFNMFGEIGDGTMTNVLSPKQITVPGAPIAQLSTNVPGTTIRETDGTVWSWGGNDQGELLDGTMTNGLAPVQSMISMVADVALAWDGGCAVKTDGTLWCWGGNQSLQLGNGSMVARSLVAVQLAPLGATPVKVMAGGSQNCVALANGAFWCWGRNFEGQLGNGANTNVGLPTPLRCSSFH